VLLYIKTIWQPVAHQPKTNYLSFFTKSDDFQYVFFVNTWVYSSLFMSSAVAAELS